MFLLFKWKMCVGRESVVPIFAFLTAQNCELNAQGNLWLEIREFCACSYMLLIHKELWGLWLKRAIVTIQKKLHFIAKGVLLPSNCSPFALSLLSFCLAKVVLLNGKKPWINKNMNDLRCKTSENAVANLYNRFLFCNTFLLPVRYLSVTILWKRRNA